MRCVGCGVGLELGDPCYETARNDFWCTGCCLPAVAGEHPIVGGKVLMRTEYGYDDATA